jgi:hypothetical protein
VRVRHGERNYVLRPDPATGAPMMERRPALVFELDNPGGEPVEVAAVHFKPIAGAPALVELRARRTGPPVVPPGGRQEHFVFVHDLLGRLAGRRPWSQVGRLVVVDAAGRTWRSRLVVLR